MTKFKVGDEVVVVESYGDTYLPIGTQATIEVVDGDYYSVGRPLGRDYTVWYRARELRHKTLNDATPAEWDKASRASTQTFKQLDNGKLFVGEGYPEQHRFEAGYWNGDMTTLGSLAVPSVDLVNAPPHYNQGGLECIDYINQQLSEEAYKGYLEGNSIKYLHRHKYKGGVEDLDKAMWYLEKLKEAQ